jgi:hypothetical protein
MPSTRPTKASVGNDGMSGTLGWCYERMDPSCAASSPEVIDSNAVAQWPHARAQSNWPPNQSRYVRRRNARRRKGHHFLVAEFALLEGATRIAKSWRHSRSVRALCWRFAYTSLRPRWRDCPQLSNWFVCLYLAGGANRGLSPLASPACSDWAERAARLFRASRCLNLTGQMALWTLIACNHRPTTA